MNGNRYVLRLSICGLILLEVACAAVQYTDLWAVHIPGGWSVAQYLADKHGFILRDAIMKDYYHFQHRKVAKRSIYPSHHYHRNLAEEPNVKWLEQQISKRRVKRDVYFNDPKWPRMWYLNRGPGLDMNVRGAWRNGYTGKGVVVTILDDGIETNHPDLIRNYDKEASYDVNNHDPDPQPRYDFSNENRHGTRCAGEVAAQADNHICSVGVAYDAKIGGVRMLDGEVTDSVEAQSLALNPEHIHIYSASWGPDDDGRTVDGPATLARKAFFDGITKGRGGLGSIFVWASGNGGRDGDSCNCDGYTNSIYTLSISSATENGNIPWYSEACSSTLVTTYSSGSGNERQIVTTDLRSACTETHTGTSASAPLAAGLCALALQANPMLTWRDMQHLVIMTAKPMNLHAPDWVVNGVGRKVSHSFGYGLMDAYAMVTMAKNWTSIPEQHICEIRSYDTNTNNRVIPQHGKITVPLYTEGCEHSRDNYVQFLEHVQARVTLTSMNRGSLQIYLTSPRGTRSVLLARRARDTSRDGFNNWAFMTTHNWGEIAKGTWILEIENGPTAAELHEWTLVVMGTATHPQKHNVTPVHPGPANSQKSIPCAGEPNLKVCVECKIGYFQFQSKKCVERCPNHYYGVMERVVAYEMNNVSNSNTTLSTLRGACRLCNTACLICRGPNVTDCFECNSGYRMTNSTCIKKSIFSLYDADTITYVVWAVILCCLAIFTFFLVFIALQAREKGWLCWDEARGDVKGKYNAICQDKDDILEDDIEKHEPTVKNSLMASPS